MPSLARHHNVVITDAAVRASIELTDLWVPDRRRPDKAIDALDEACAHTQATATYSERAESLISRRRAWLREAQKKAAIGARQADHDSVNRMARGGIAALERIGAELEAAFVRPAPTEYVAPEPAPREPTGVERAALDVELERVLLEDGIVVRGHDVARVVGLMTGRRVEWEE
jgi:ATP-dependent Clp protease ATP-binding subunit ClpA